MDLSDLPIPEPPTPLNPGDLTAGGIETRRRGRRFPWIGLAALLIVAISIAGLFVGYRVIDANTPDSPPNSGLRLDLERLGEAAADELISDGERADEASEPTRSRLSAFWSSLRGEASDETASEAEATPDAEASTDTDSSVTKGFAITLASGTPTTSPARPRWVDWLDASLVFLVVGGLVLGVLMGAVSPWLGEWAWVGVLAVWLGVTSLNFLLLAMYIALIVGVILILALLAVLKGLTGDIGVELPDIDMPGV